MEKELLAFDYNWHSTEPNSVTTPIALMEKYPDQLKLDIAKGQIKHG